MGKGPKWSDEENEFLIECVEAGKDPVQISSEFHVRSKMNIKGYHKRSPAAIERHLYDLSIKPPVDESKPANHRRAWAPGDDDLLLTYDDMGLQRDELADMFNRTEVAIESRLKVLRSKKDHHPWLARLIGYFIHIFRRFGHEV